MVNRSPGKNAKVLMGGGFPAFIKTEDVEEWAKEVTVMIFYVPIWRTLLCS